MIARCRFQRARRRSDEYGIRLWLPTGGISALTESDPAENSQARDRSLQVIPITDISCPALDLDRVANPVPAIMRSAEFVQTKRFFAESPSASRSLLTDVAQALLYSVIRSLRPEHVVEIGTYKAGTAEGLARAVLANGFGTV